MNYELALEQFQGPMDKLLELIEKRHLEITEISLSQITEDFFAYLQTLAAPIPESPQRQIEAEHKLRILADFIVIASRLVLIKSKSLLPDLTLTPDEQESIYDLQNRLKLYQTVKPAMKLLARAWKERQPNLSRPYFLQSVSTHLPVGDGISFFYPGEGLKMEGMVEAVRRIVETLEKLHHETETIQGKIVSLEEEMNTIIHQMAQLKNTSFSQLSTSKSRSEVVVMFLAILHLAHTQAISLTQSSQFSDIMIKHQEESIDANIPMY